MKTETKKEFCLRRIDEIIELIVDIQPLKTSTIENLLLDQCKWIKFYARELANECKECEEKNENESKSNTSDS